MPFVEISFKVSTEFSGSDSISYIPVVSDQNCAVSRGGGGAGIAIKNIIRATSRESLFFRTRCREVAIDSAIWLVRYPRSIGDRQRITSSEGQKT